MNTNDTNGRSASNSIDIYVCGIFHYRYYCHHLDRIGKLRNIFYSYRKLKELAPLKDRSINFPAKEFILQFIIRMRRGSFGPVLVKNLQKLWAWQVCRHIAKRPSADLNLVLLCGSALPIIRELRSRGKIVIGEAVNAHPEELSRVLAEDARHHGVLYRMNEALLRCKLDEIAAVDYLLAPSAEVARSYMRQGFDPEKIKILPYGVNRPMDIKITEKVLGRQRSIVLLVGQLIPRKGQIHFLNAIRDSCDSLDVKFIGRGEPEYIKCMRDTGVPFELIPHMPHDEVLSAMSAADIVCLNSIEDGFGMVIAEAIAVHTPVLVSRYAGVSEYVSRMGGGIVVDPLNYKEVSSCLLEVLGGKFPTMSSNLPRWEDYANSLAVLIDEIHARHHEH